MDNRYAAIDAWNELIYELYGAEGKYRIETFIERMELGLIDWLPRWTILYGGPGSGKSTLIYIISTLFKDQYLPIEGYKPYDFGQYNGILGICHDADVDGMYREITENWTLSKDYHLLLGTLMRPETDIKESHEIIQPTGNRISKDRYDELMDIIYHGIPELKLYFKHKAASDFMERRL